MNVSVEDGKYTYVFRPNGEAEILRYGETWKDATGDKFSYCMAAELEAARTENAALKEQVAQLEHSQAYEKQQKDGFVSLGKFYSEQEDKFNDPYNPMCKFKRKYLSDCEDELAIQPSPDMLRDRDARLVERIATHLESYEYLKNQPPINYAEAHELRVIADKIRKGD